MGSGSILTPGWSAGIGKSPIDGRLLQGYPARPLEGAAPVNPSPSLSPEALLHALEALWMAQHEAVAQWHQHQMCLPPGEDLMALGLRQHRCNFDLWHVEDEARRQDVSEAVIAACKRKIDVLNQERNDLMEVLDQWFVAVIASFPAQRGLASEVPGHTETLGAVVDRMSVLSLKIYHMAEEARRLDAGEAHVARCQQRLELLWRQQRELRQAVAAAVEDYAAGRRRPRVYFQCKMYNDPSLNPALYRVRQKEQGGVHAGV